MLLFRFAAFHFGFYSILLDGSSNCGVVLNLNGETMAGIRKPSELSVYNCGISLSFLITKHASL